MAYKVGTTIVIDNSGNLDWSRIVNKPAIGTGDITAVTVTNGAPGGGANISHSYTAPYVGNCYVESISGGGTSGDVTVTSVRRQFNCNCNCRC
jgi:hypothetical protein